MTGGQPVDGPVSVHAIAHAVRAEGVERIALVSDAPEKFGPGDVPSGTTIHHRDALDAVQRDLREVPGVSVLIYEQTCATEKRRRRKRGTLPDPARHVVINDLVCEGCGDCSVASNCLSVEPKETPFGRKRQVNLSTCNKDFSCLDGFCPSFVTIEGGRRRRRTGAGIDAVARAAALPMPPLPGLDRPYDLLVTGVGGTGVVTVGALITMAAHLEGRGVSVLDFTGFAQKFGPVLSYVRLADTPAVLNQVRIDQGAADALIGCDLVVSSSPKASGTYRRGTRAVVNTAEMPTGDVVRLRDADLASARRLGAVAAVIGRENLLSFDANAASDTLLGDTVYANVMMLGAAWQAGLVPVSLEALTRAIALNGVAVAANGQALAWGRIAVADPTALRAALGPEASAPDDLDAVIARRTDFLAAYQDAAYAARYRDRVERLRAAEAARGGEALTDAAARSLFKLMAYKDEYEVARLHLLPGFEAQIAEGFEGDYRIVHHLAPPLLAAGRDARGRPKKRAFGPWVRKAFALLAPMKRLRGSPFDPFGYTAERRMERELVAWFEALVDGLIERVGTADRDGLLAIARAPMEIRGYGPVKHEAVDKVRAEVARLWSQLDAPRPRPAEPARAA
jgi:indolepyruvate ferredoxin oxidoreductase